MILLECRHQRAENNAFKIFRELKHKVFACSRQKKPQNPKKTNQNSKPNQGNPTSDTLKATNGSLMLTVL